MTTVQIIMRMEYLSVTIISCFPFMLSVFSSCPLLSVLASNLENNFSITADQANMTTFDPPNLHVPSRNMFVNINRWRSEMHLIDL